MQFLRKLFGLLRPETPPTQVATPPAQPAAPGASTPVAERILFVWQEMLDGQSQIAGYRLQARALDKRNVISGTAIRAALLAENVHHAGGQRPLLISLTVEQWQTADFSEIIAPQTFILLSDIESDPAPQQRLAEIRAAGARTAIHDDAAGADSADWPLDLVLFAFRKTELATQEKHLQSLSQRPGLLLVADGVESWAEHRLCQRIGFKLSIGGFAGTRDQEAPPGKISESRLVVLDMLNQIRSDAELGTLAATALRDPAVVVKLLDMANSPLYGLPRKVASLEEAITLLGRDALYRWLSLALFNIEGNDGRDRTLLVLALCRAALLEGLATGHGKQTADEAFLVGLLSIADSLLDRPMADVLAHIHLPAAVKAALLHNEGHHARFLQLAIMLERCRLDQAVVLAGALQLSPATLIESYRKALGWASAVLDQ